MKLAVVSRVRSLGNDALYDQLVGRGRGQGGEQVGRAEEEAWGDKAGGQGAGVTVGNRRGLQPPGSTEIAVVRYAWKVLGIEPLAVNSNQ